MFVGWWWWGDNWGGISELVIGSGCNHVSGMVMVIL